MQMLESKIYECLTCKVLFFYWARCHRTYKANWPIEFQNPRQAWTTLRTVFIIKKPQDTWNWVFSLYFYPKITNSKNVT